MISSSEGKLHLSFGLGGEVHGEFDFPDQEEQTRKVEIVEHFVITLLFLIGIFGVYGYVRQGMQHRRNPLNEEKPGKDVLIFFTSCFLLAFWLFFHQ